MDKEIKIRILELLETRQFNDNEIARRLGCGPSTVREHRKRLGFPVVKKQRESPLKAKIIELLETRQFNDEEIARRVGCSHTIVARYRKRLGLEVVKKRVERTSPLKSKIIELLETRQFNDSEIARELGCSPSQQRWKIPQTTWVRGGKETGRKNLTSQSQNNRTARNSAVQRF